ncbi:MAG: MarR family transcriptional regulator [Rhizobiales bacterium]|nr:MarR family transcriptional regulator [Hyphomicrobiales bacterium]
MARKTSEEPAQRQPAKRASDRALPQPPLVQFDRTVPPVRRVLIAMARRLFQICTTATAEVLVKEDLTPMEYGVIGYLNGEPDIDQSGLAARLGIDRNHTSLLVDQLERKRLVERRVNGADRRAKLLRLTPRGTALYARLMPTVFAAQSRLIDILAPAEREQLFDLLGRVIEGNKMLARPGTGRRKRGSRESSSNKT